MIVAAGGSGGAAKAEGAPGRDQNRRYRNCEGKSALLNQTCSNYKELVSRLTIQNSGNAKICYGQDGKYSGTIPASVGGGDIKVAFQPMKPVVFMIPITSPLLTAALHACLSTDPM